MSDLLQQEKSLCRARCRAAAPSPTAEESAALCRQVLALPEYRAASTLLVFYGMPDEPDTRALLSAALADGKRVCLPRWAGRGMMQARRVPSMAALRPDRWGIPAPGEDCPVVPPEALELIAAPCVACTPDGVRLGRGAGYYDRYTAGLRVPVAVLCPAARLLPALPAGPHDRRVDLIVTETAVFRPGCADST